jgi:hypothetical protein
MEHTYENVAALAGRAVGPLASHLGRSSGFSMQLHPSMESLGGIDPTTNSSLSSKTCDNADYVPSAHLLALIVNRVTTRRDIVRHGT